MTANVIPLFPDGCPNCRKLADNYERELQRIGEDLHNAELSIRGLRSSNKQKQNELDGIKNNHTRLPEAKEVFEYWRAELHPLAKKLDGARLKNVLARLDDGYTVDQLKQAVDGAKLTAYVDPKGVRHDDLELICRDDQHVLRFINAVSAKPKADAKPVDVALVPWTEVRRENRRQIVKWLTGRYGDGTADGILGRQWPCPRCLKRGWDVWLTVAPADAPGWLVRCNGCQLDEVVLLRVLAQQRAQERQAC